MNQWPSAIKYRFNKRLNNFSEEKLYTIEKFLSKKFKSKYAFLCPSSRSSINLILNYLKFDRSKIVNIPKWSSHSLYATIGAITNVSVQNFKSNCILVVHKWGNTYRCINKRSNSITIEDSADCLPNEKFLPFENNSKYEIISLPKIIGTYSGGIVLTNDKKFYNFGKNRQRKNKKLGIIQSQKKYNYRFDKPNSFNSWFHDEAYNTSFDGNVVENIYECLDYFDYNSDLIKKRQKVIRYLFPKINFDKKRIGPCSIFPKKRYFFFKNLLNTRFFDFSKNTKRENFEKSLILPIHFGVKDFEFEKKINSMIKVYKQNK